MKSVGIISGLGPETTAKFYLQIINGCVKNKLENRPSILIESISLPVQVEREVIMEAKGKEQCLPLLLQTAQNLEKGGVDFLVMPCNSLHIFIEEIQNAVKIPILNIVEEATKLLKERNVNSISVVGTSITINSRLYTEHLQSRGIVERVPTKNQQKALDKIVYRIVKNGPNSEDRRELENILHALPRGDMQPILLACTDLQLLEPSLNNVRIYDTFEILVDATIREICN